MVRRDIVNRPIFPRDFERLVIDLAGISELAVVGLRVPFPCECLFSVGLARGPSELLLPSWLVVFQKSDESSQIVQVIPVNFTRLRLI